MTCVPTMRWIIVQTHWRTCSQRPTYTWVMCVIKRSWLKHYFTTMTQFNVEHEVSVTAQLVSLVANEHYTIVFRDLGWSGIKGPKVQWDTKRFSPSEATRAKPTVIPDYWGRVTAPHVSDVWDFQHCDGRDVFLLESYMFAFFSFDNMCVVMCWI